VETRKRNLVQRRKGEKRKPKGGIHVKQSCGMVAPIRSEEKTEEKNMRIARGRKGRENWRESYGEPTRQGDDLFTSLKEKNVQGA